MDASQFGGSFWLAVIGSVSAFAIVFLAAMNRSKCSNISCCFGMFNCTRDVKVEEEIELRTSKGPEHALP